MSGDAPTKPDCLPADLSTAAAEAAEAEAARRPIETIVNPDPRVDYLVRLDGAVGALGAGSGNGETGAQVRLVFVPDKRILPGDAFPTYLARLAEREEATGGEPERLALRILDDLNDELVPRWLQVTITTADGRRVLVEDRQPKWDDKALLARVQGL
jgi:7-cyano-7-deazaguanine reductase